jgi:hypothetical protein
MERPPLARDAARLRRGGELVQLGREFFKGVHSSMYYHFLAAGGTRYVLWWASIDGGGSGVSVTRDEMARGDEMAVSVRSLLLNVDG